MQAELNNNVNVDELNTIYKDQILKKGWLKEMLDHKVPYNQDKMFAALENPAIGNVKVVPLHPGDIISKDGKQMRVSRIDSETGEPILEAI